jgi:hypothetical protein
LHPLSQGRREIEKLKERVNGEMFEKFSGPSKKVKIIFGD